jgi:hypothetical protein
MKYPPKSYPRHLRRPGSAVSSPGKISSLGISQRRRPHRLLRKSASGDRNFGLLLAMLISMPVAARTMQRFKALACIDHKSLEICDRCRLWGFLFLGYRTPEVLKYRQRKLSCGTELDSVTSAWIAKNVHGSTWARKFFENVVHRVDDVTEILSCYATLNGSLHSIPMALKRGLAAALSGFSEYALTKYRGEGKALKLVDAGNLLHPRHSEALKALVAGTLKSAVALDRSASMRCAINRRSFGETPVPILVSDVGAIFAAALGKKRGRRDDVS